MPTVFFTPINGEEEEAKVSQREAYEIKKGFNSGSPFSFVDDDETWVWFNTDAFLSINIEKD